MADSSRYTNDDLQTRRALASAMMRQGMDTSPISSPWQGLARIAQAMIGGANLHGIGEEGRALEKEARDRETATWNSLPGLGGSDEWSTMVTPTNDTPSPALSTTASKFTPDESASIRSLLANPLTRAAGLKLYTDKISPAAPEYDFKTVGKQLVKVNKKTGDATPVFSAGPEGAGESVSNEALLQMLGVEPHASAEPTSLVNQSTPMQSPLAPISTPPSATDSYLPPMSPPSMMRLGGPVPTEDDINPETGANYTPEEIDEATLLAGGVGSPLPGVTVSGMTTGPNGETLDPTTHARLVTMLQSKDPSLQALGRALALKVIGTPPKASPERVAGARERAKADSEARVKALAAVETATKYDNFYGLLDKPLELPYADMTGDYATYGDIVGPLAVPQPIGGGGPGAIPGQIISAIGAVPSYVAKAGKDIAGQIYPEVAGSRRATNVLDTALTDLQAARVKELFGSTNLSDADREAAAKTVGSLNAQNKAALREQMEVGEKQTYARIAKAIQDRLITWSDVPEAIVRRGVAIGAFKSRNGENDGR